VKGVREEPEQPSAPARQRPPETPARTPPRPRLSPAERLEQIRKTVRAADAVWEKSGGRRPATPQPPPEPPAPTKQPEPSPAAPEHSPAPEPQAHQPNPPTPTLRGRRPPHYAERIKGQKYAERAMEQEQKEEAERQAEKDKEKDDKEKEKERERERDRER
jgi:hypothetical protein